jgi:hypothetical protein
MCGVEKFFVVDFLLHSVLHLLKTKSILAVHSLFWGLFLGLVVVAFGPRLVIEMLLPRILDLVLSKSNVVCDMTLHCGFVVAHAE